MQFLINYNEAFAVAKPTPFRGAVIQQTLSALIGMNKPNALLIGPAGVGKTRIVEDIARRLANGDLLIPEALKGYTIYELPLSAIVSGSKMTGMVEEKLETVVEFIEDPDQKAILFIDEIHRLVNSREPTYQKIAQILKPALARGKMRVIGATTTQEARDLMIDPAFNRRFSRVIVDELTREQTVKLLGEAKFDFVEHYGNKVYIDPSMAEITVAIADQYSAAGSHRPDNALTLLDRAAANAVIKRQLEMVQAQQRMREGDSADWERLQKSKWIQLTEQDIRSTAIQLATGNSKPAILDVEHLRAALSRIKGQDPIIAELIRQLRISELNLWEKKRPLTMLFIGPSGVGKTEVTKIIAKEITGGAPIILDMTEYSSSGTITRIIGSPTGYVGSDSHAELPFDSLESNPYQVILLDEFEKCHQEVQRLFMSAFDEGYIKTNRGAVVDFSKCIIIATTNAAHDTSRKKKPVGFATSDDDNENQTSIRDLSAYFDIALLNRFKKCITFNEIDRATYAEIVRAKYAAEIAAIKQNPAAHCTLPDQIDPATCEEIVRKTYAPQFGARPVENAVRDYIVDQMLD